MIGYSKTSRQQSKTSRENLKRNCGSIREKRTNRELEIERVKFERDEMDFELQMKATEVKKASSVKI